MIEITELAGSINPMRQCDEQTGTGSGGTLVGPVVHDNMEAPPVPYTTVLVLALLLQHKRLEGTLNSSFPIRTYFEGGVSEILLVWTEADQRWVLGRRAGVASNFMFLMRVCGIRKAPAACRPSLMLMGSS
jgi:hypothetical protein